MRSCVGRCRVVLPALLAVVAAVSAAEVPDALARRLRHIEKAFREGDASALRPSLSAKGRIRVDLGALTGGASTYGRGQLEVVMGRLFDAHPTESIGFDEDVAVSGATAYALASWEHHAAGGAVRRQPITFVLGVEEGEWRIVEMRSSR